MAFSGVMGRMEHTMGPSKGPAFTVWMLVLYMGTFCVFRCVVLYC